MHSFYLLKEFNLNFIGFVIKIDNFKDYQS